MIGKKIRAEQVFTTINEARIYEVCSIAIRYLKSPKPRKKLISKIKYYTQLLCLIHILT